MNVLFLTIVGIEDISERGIYTDLMRHFRDNGHQVHIVCPKERRFKKKTTLKIEDNIQILNVKTLNIQKTNIIEKGIGTLLIEHQFLSAIKKYFKSIKFDLVIYSTPPITFTKVINYIKTKDQAKSYLLLKDIFPQNAVDLGMIKPNGIIHRYFKRREEALYAISDHIGCMSPANVEYIKKYHKGLDPTLLEVNPNSIDPTLVSLTTNEKIEVRNQYNIPLAVTAFIYGGNLGKPQGIDFLIDVLNANLDKDNVFFLIVGSGTEYSKLKDWFVLNKPTNMALYSSMLKSEYDRLLQSCDVGLIFLDNRFTIPNFPSRLLSYMECKMPVLAATDINTDIGQIIERNKFGFWCENGDVSSFNEKVNLLAHDKGLREELASNSVKYLMDNYLTSHSYKKIIEHM